MSKIEDNTVSSKGQLNQDSTVYVRTGTGAKILFVGNSITRHGPNPGIGWPYDWGMAASKQENDYVHKTMEQVDRVDPDASFLIFQIADWEREYWNIDVIGEALKEVEAYTPDIIVMRIIENVTLKDGEDFGEYYEALVRRLAKPGNAKVILTNSFWLTPEKEDDIRQVANRTDWPLIELNDLGVDDTMTAAGLFEHKGVAAHPGDKGMQVIADRICELLLPMVQAR